MPQKLVVWGGVALVVFYLVAAPQMAASTVKHAGVGLGHMLHQVSVFLKSLV
ncbi:MAG TPA: hypothetical protein VFA11_03105 [Acidimicrobiales bacterium]|nr:hypothetical protein [Acidimicrobiales bacterium]